MDVFNKAAAQINELLRTMTPGARLTAGLLLAVVVVSIAYLFNTQVSGNETYLLGGRVFSAGELASMEAAFGKAGLSGYRVEANRVSIPAEQQAAFMGAMADEGAMPSDFLSFLSSATKDVGPFTSRQQQEEMLKVARQKELALIIRSMRDIENAAVLFDEQKKGGLNRDVLMTASVSIKPVGGQPLDEQQVPMIRHLVAGAIAGLSPDNVTVIDLNGRTYSGSSSGPLGSAAEDPYLARKQKYQADWESMIRGALSYVTGITVTANVELDRELTHQMEQVKIDPKPVALTTREQSNISSSETPGAAGPPGLASQQPNAAASLAGVGGPRNEEENTTSETQSVTSHDRITTEMAGLTPRRVSVSVGIPASYFESVWRQRQPPSSSEEEQPKTPDPAELAQIEREETAKIRAHVAALIPLPVDTTVDPASLVTVTTFSTVEMPQLPEPGVAVWALDWLGRSWSTLAMLGLAAFSLMLVRSTLKGVSSTEPPPVTVFSATVSEPVSTSEAAPAPLAEGNAQTPAAKRQLKRRFTSGKSMKEELTEMVKEDPDAAANILRSWIGATNN